MRKVIISIVVILFFSSFTFARTITVGKEGNYDFNSIQDAIDDANESDTVLVYPGFYDEYADFKGKNIIVKSTNPNDPNIIEKTIINWGAVFSGTETSDCILSGFKLNFPIWGTHTHAVISLCIFSGPDLRGSAIENFDGEIKNCLITDNSCAGGDKTYPLIVECYGLIKNCTISNNGTGIFIGNILSEGGTTTIENCIIYDNHLAGFDDPQIYIEHGGTLNISYTCIQGGRENIINFEGVVNWGPGNIENDPCFVRVGDRYLNITGDYHLQSQGGRWDRNSESWITDSNTSPCIDAGNPADPIGYEPFPSGGRINMGFYGGTIEASKSYFGKPPCETIIAGDINGDCVVNFADFAVMASHWLEQR